LQWQEKAALVKDQRLKGQMILTSVGLRKRQAMLENQMHMQRQGTSTTKKNIMGLVPRSALGKGGKGDWTDAAGKKFIADWSRDVSSIRKFEMLANKVKGKRLTPEMELLGIFGTDAGQIMPRVRMLAMSIYRNLEKADSGNLSNRDAKAMAEAITGKKWNKAYAIYQNLTRLAKEAKIRMMDTVMRLDRAGVDTTPLRPGLYRN
jgi:hypothetical protein